MFETKSQSSMYIDRAGHVHKYFALDLKNSMDLSKKGRKQFLPFQLADETVATAALRAFDLYDAFRLAFSQHNLGDSVTAQDVADYQEWLKEEKAEKEEPWHVEYEWEQSEQSEGEEGGTAEKQQDEGDFLSPEEMLEEIQVGPHSTRGLQAVYKWHQIAERGSAPEACPEFAILPTRDHWETNSPVIVDPYNLEVRVALGSEEERIPLPKDSDGTGSEEIAIWRDYVMRYFVPGMDFRPMERGKISLGVRR